MHDFIIHIAGANSEAIDLRLKITYLADKTFVLQEVQQLADAVAVISVDAQLKRITKVEQLAIALTEVARQTS